MALAHSISARLGPEYSSTMASWIMVSSRCVVGLSTGMRPVSAMATRASAAKARAWTAEICEKSWPHRPVHDARQASPCAPGWPPPSAPAAAELRPGRRPAPPGWLPCRRKNCRHPWPPGKEEPRQRQQVHEQNEVALSAQQRGTMQHRDEGGRGHGCCEQQSRGRKRKTMEAEGGARSSLRNNFSRSA